MPGEPRPINRQNKELQEPALTHIQWKDRYNIGYKDIDVQHRVLLDLLNELVDLIEQGKAQEGISDIFTASAAMPSPTSAPKSVT
jgi:hypothetical protein